MYVNHMFQTLCNRVLSLAGLFVSGLGLSLSKCFGPISDLLAKQFCSFVTYIRCAQRGDLTSLSEVIVISLQLILFTSTATFFCYLLGLVSHSF